MEISKKFLHDRLILLLVTSLAVLLVIGVSSILFRFDISKNPTTVVAYRPNISGSSIIAGKPIDLYSLAIFIIFTATAAVFLSSRIYKLRRSVAVFVLGGANFLLVLAAVVANALISLQ